VRDFRPVRPLSSPTVRALALMPIALAIVVAVPALLRIRFDIYAVGPARAWLLSLAQGGIGVAVIGLSMRESVPGRALSAAALVATLIAGAIVPAAVLAMTAQFTMLGPAPGHAVRDGLICFRTSALAALPALAACAVLAARAWPMRPAVAGLLYGLGSGLIADAGLRLFCEYSAPDHVTLWHGAGIVTATLGGMLIAVALDRLTEWRARA
jgi:hypothetical protein